MSYSIVGNGFIMTCGLTGFICPYCTRPDDGLAFSEALSKAKRPYVYKKCKGCKRKLFVTCDMTGDLIVTEYIKVSNK